MGIAFDCHSGQVNVAQDQENSNDTCEKDGHGLWLQKLLISKAQPFRKLRAKVKG